MSRALYSLLITPIALPVACFAIVNVSFDSVTTQGQRWTDLNYTGTSPNAYVGTFVDNTNDLKMRITLIDVIGGGGTKPEGSYAYVVNGDNAVVGVTYDFNTSTGAERTTDDGFVETGPADGSPGIFARYRVEFLNSDNTARAPDNYLLSIFDIDFTQNERIERFQIQDQYVSRDFRYKADGTPTTNIYSGAQYYNDPDLNANAPKDVSFVKRSANQTLNGVEFRTYEGLANFQSLEESTNASPMGGVSVVLSDVQTFEFIIGGASTNTNVATRSRFILDFSNPPDNPNVIVPEPGSFASVAALLAFGLVLSLRRRIK